ncbi:MAG: CdaR family protein [Thermodesulfobacteriota bacterium]
MRNTFKNTFFKNLGKKILAIVIAIAIWFLVSIESNVEKEITMIVNYVNLPKGLVITNNPPEDLNLVVRGPRSRLSTLSPQNFEFSLDLSNVTQGVSKFDIRTDQIKPPRGLQVTGISPAEIELEVDELVQKTVDVKVIFSSPETGYDLVDMPEVTPKDAIISGPKILLSKINEITTDTVSTKGVKSNFTIEVPLRTTNPLIKVVGDKTVRVTVNIRESTIEKEFKDVDIKFVNFENLNFEPIGVLKAELSFEGPYSKIKDLNSDDIKVYVDVGDLKKSDRKLQRLKVSVSYPFNDSIKLKKQEPKTLEVRHN